MSAFKAWCPTKYQTEDDARPVDASSWRHAAEEWAAWHDSFTAEYDIVSGKDVCVVVACEDERRTFWVSGESVPSYTARPAAGRQSS